jgi:hypothetical protein
MGVLAKKLKLQKPICRSPRDWMKDWSLADPFNIPESSRYKCFAEVQTMADKLLEDEDPLIKGTRLKSSRFSDTTQIQDSAAEWHSRLFRKLCLPHFEELALVFSERETKYIVIAFDECSQFPHMSLVALQRMIKAYDAFKPDDVTFWFLLLDTNSSIYDLTPWGDKAVKEAHGRFPRTASLALYWIQSDGPQEHH